MGTKCSFNFIIVVLRLATMYSCSWYWVSQQAAAGVVHGDCWLAGIIKFVVIRRGMIKPDVAVCKLATLRVVVPAMQWLQRNQRKQNN
jgi:hypothetical protein